MPGGSLAARRITESVEKSDDAFGNRIVQNTEVEADLAGHYPYSPERWHLYVNGARQFPQYGDVPELTDAPDVHRLIPQNEGDVVTLRTTEVFRYIVGYVLEWSCAFQTNQPLQDGDAVAVGYGNPDFENSADDTPGPNADGWFYLWDSILEPGTVRLAQYRDGTEQDSRVVSTTRAIEEWKRYEGRTNWYAVGRTRFSETYTKEDDNKKGPRQFNEQLGRTAVQRTRGPLKGNQRLRYSIKAGSGAGSIELEAGSAAMKTLGAGDTIVREKTHEFAATPSATGAWEPIHAMRIAPGQNIVNIQIKNTDIVAFDDGEDVTATIQLFDASNVADSNGDPLTNADFSTPPAHSEKNSALEVSNAVAQVADETGVLQPSMQSPGGYQVGYSSWYTVGTGTKTQRSSGGRTRKRQLPDGDIGVVLINATATTADVVGEIITEQDW